MKTRIDWVRHNCRLLSSISEEFRAQKPFAGLTIGTGIHLEPKTVALILTLQDGGARLVSTGNLNTTQPAAMDYLRERGVTVIGQPTRDRAEHRSYLNAVVAEKPDALPHPARLSAPATAAAPWGTTKSPTPSPSSTRIPSSE